MAEQINGKDILVTLIELLAMQERVKIKFEIIEDGKEQKKMKNKRLIRKVKNIICDSAKIGITMYCVSKFIEMLTSFMFYDYTSTVVLFATLAWIVAFFYKNNEALSV